MVHVLLTMKAPLVEALVVLVWAEVSAEGLAAVMQMAVALAVVLAHLFVEALAGHMFV